MDKHRLSISQLNMLSKCGEQYRRRYVMGHKVPSGLSLVTGIVVDNMVTKNLQTKMDIGSTIAADMLEEMTRIEFRKTFSRLDISFSKEEIAEGEDKTIAQGEEKSVRLTLLHAAEFAPVINPTYLQRSLSVELPGYPFDIGGVIDIQEADSVRDTKTSGKTPSIDVADNSDQLTVYAMLVMLNDGAIPTKICLDYLIDTKTPKAQSFYTVRTEDDFNPLLERIGAACIAIEKGVFIPANESDWWCSEAWCGYWNSCKYVRKAKRPAA